MPARTNAPLDVAAVLLQVLGGEALQQGTLLGVEVSEGHEVLGRHVQGDLSERMPGTPTRVVGMRNVPAIPQCVEMEEHVALQSEWIAEAAHELLAVKAAAPSSSKPATMPPGDGPLVPPVSDRG